MLDRICVGFGGLALRGLLSEQGVAAPSPAEANPLMPKVPHFAPRAKRVIFLFLQGGPSHVDTFDPKPLLDRDDGKPLPFKATRVQFAKRGNSFVPWARVAFP